eukprot:s162_g45.t1
MSDLAVVRMGVDDVTLTGRVVRHHPLVLDCFRDLQLPGKRCAHDITDQFQLRVSHEQWLCVVSKVSKIICLQAFVFGDLLDVCMEGGGVIPAPECRGDDSSQLVHVLELFCGGFSGWSHVTRALKTMHLPVETSLAVDIDLDCVLAYSKTFGATMHIGGTPLQLSVDEKIPSKLVIQADADVADFSWVHLLGCEKYEMGVASPPCPPWSAASVSAPGLRRNDGCLTPFAIALLALCGCRVICIENVSGMVHHPHWGIIQQWLRAWKWDLRWSKTLDLAEVASQKRDRLLLIATKSHDGSLMPHVPCTWPKVAPPSMQQFDVLLCASDHWLDEARPTDEVLKLYLDPANLPKQSSSNRSSKRSRVDVARYRIKTPQEQMTCLMANYSQGHLLPRHVIESGGLCGGLVALPDGLRFLTTPEVLLHQIPLGDQWLPRSRKVAISILGNSISSAHAAISVLNGLAFITDLTHVDIFELFARLLDMRLKASRLSIVAVQDGYLFQPSEIEPTAPMHLCDRLVLRSPADEVLAYVQAGLNVLAVIKALMGSSTPAQIFMLPAGILAHRIDLPTCMTMPRERLILFSDVMGGLLLPTSMFVSIRDSQVVLALCTFGPVLIARRQNMRTSDVIDFLKLEFDFRRIFCVDMMGFPLEEGIPCPDAVVVLPKQGLQPMSTASLLELDVGGERMCVTFNGMPGDLASFLELLCTSGIHDLLQCMGWTFVVPISHIRPHGFELIQFVKMPGTFAIESDDALRCLSVLLFVLEFGTIQSIGDNPAVRVRFKFWNSWIWEGMWDPACNFAHVRTTWLDIMRKFSFDWEIRLVLNGHNINPDRSLSEFLDPLVVSQGEVKIFLVISLRGGGPKSDSRTESTRPASSGLRRRLPTPPRSPNTTEVPPTPPSVPGTPPSPPRPPTPPNPPRLASRSRSPAESQEGSEYSTDSQASGRMMPSNPETLLEVFELDRNESERALRLALLTWTNLSNIDWDVGLSPCAPLRMTTQGHLLYINGDLKLLMRLAQSLHQVRLDFVVDKMGWLTSVQFQEFSNPVRARIVFIPNPNMDSISQKLLYTFLKSAFVIMRLPRGVHETDDTVFTKIKVWGYTAFVGWLPKTLLVESLLEPWAFANSILGIPTPMRAVGFACTLNPDYRIWDYAKRDSQNKLYLTVHYVAGLRGGGPSKPLAQDITKAKNALATFFLGQGADIQDIAPFTDKLLAATSPATIESLLQPKAVKAKWEGISKISKALNLAIPDIVAAPASQRKKVHERIRKPVRDFTHALNLEGIKVKEGFFRNEDNSLCVQRSDVVPKESGFCLMSFAQATPWLAQTTDLSEDELAVVVLGTCECSQSSKGQRVQIPAYSAEGEPLVLSGCLHDLGKKHVKASRVETNILTPDSAVVSFTVCRDEISDEKWQEITVAPVKTVLDLCCEGLQLLAPPWGRVYQKHRVKVSPNEATSLQFHARVSKDDLTKVLQSSGAKAVYTAAKNELKQLSSDFQVVWLSHMNLVNLRVTCASYPHHRGLVRSMRSEDKIARGIRFWREDFKTAFSELRPQDSVPSDIPPKHLFKISPVPVGASAENVQTWLDGLSWKARPMRLLASNVWLCAASEVYDSQFEMWDSLPILIKWIQSRAPSDKAIKEIKDSSAKEVTQIRKDMTQLKEAISSQGKAFDKQNIINAKEFGAIREEAKEQFKALAATLQESMKTSLSKQDHAMTSQFQELKTLLQNRENPPKKPRLMTCCLKAHILLKFGGTGRVSTPAFFLNWRLAISNPTAVYKKTDEVVSLDSDVVVFSETSATSVIQTDVSGHLTRKGFRCFWSKPAPPKKLTSDSRPSFRGEALGTSIFTKLPSRVARINYPAFLWDSCRVCASVVRLGHLDVVIFAVYGFATRYQQGVRMNDMFLASIFDLVQQIDMPFIVAGDFNDPPQQLPSFSLFKQLGAVEAFSFFKAKWGYDLPATCLGSTRNDTAILHPALIPFVVNMRVDKKFQFDSHVPLFIDLSFTKDMWVPHQWKIPCSWAAMAPPSDIIAQCYNNRPVSSVFDLSSIDDEKKTEQALLAWSSSVELAVDKALNISHKLNPLVQPHVGLHPKYRGKCNVKSVFKPRANGGVSEDPTHGYTPDAEVFSMKAKQVVRQVRRLKSFRRTYKALSNSGDPQKILQLQRQLQYEWKIILHAKGFGSRWASWILAYGLVPFVPIHLPDIELLDICIDITEMHCNLICRQEARNRYQSFRHRIRVDQEDGFMSLSYRIVRGASAPPLYEVPISKSSLACLVRSSKGKMSLKLADNVSFRVNAAAWFDDFEVFLTHQVSDRVFFTTQASNIPVQGCLTQETVAMSTVDIQEGFNHFWSEYWLRDSVSEATEPPAWESFVEEIEQSGMPQYPNIEVSLQSVSLWMHAIKGLKAGKAHGVDGWRYEELKALPECCIADLASIMAKGAQYGLSKSLMAAKATLLAKVPEPLSFHQIRPITVLGVLYRLTGRIIFQQIVRVWKSSFPLLISGGLPGRGVKDLAYLLKHRIEIAISNRSQLGGFSLDLKKAFNLFPRWPIVFLWRRLGVPQWVCDFWLNSLMRLQRYPHLHGYLGLPVDSSTGAPEGDCLSVMAMLALAVAYHWCIANDQIVPHGYADNWGWSTFNQAAHRIAYKGTLRLTSSLRLLIDFNKSWHWGINRDFRQFCLDLAHLFPAGDVPIRVEARMKDLGERFNFEASMQLGNIKDKIAEAEKRCKRLRTLPLDTPSKASVIQASVWPMSLYSADTSFVGMHHFQNLRSAALFAFVGKCNFASPWLACFSLSKFLKDPLLYVILNALRSLERLVTICRDTALNIIEAATSFVGSKPFGPASSLKRYLEAIGWTIHSDASLVGPEHFRLNLLTDSTSKICHTFYMAWPYFLVQNLSRKGTGDFVPHYNITSKVMASFSPSDQSILVRNLVGGFQTAATQKMWDSDTAIACPLCGADDTRAHRLLECDKFAHIREAHKEALRILQDVRPEWVFVPLAHSSPDVVLQRAFLHTIQPGSDLVHYDATQSVVFYTDGGAINPTDPDARLASWAVVSDTSALDIPGIQLMSSVTGEGMQCPLFRVVGSGLVSGHQSAARGELVAFWKALVAAENYDDIVSVSVVTDASYVCFVDYALRNNLCDFPNHKTRNGDVIREIKNHWNERIHVFKTKSHRSLDDATDWHDLWTIYGNSAADLAATVSLRNVPLEIRSLFSNIASFHKAEAAMLQTVLTYMVELNRARDAAMKSADIVGQPIKQDEPTSQLTNRRFMVSFKGPILLLLSLSGLLTANGLDVSKEYDRSDDWGISWLELLFSFVLFSKRLPPVKSGGQTKNAVFYDYNSQEALCLPTSSRAASRTYYTFHQAILAIRTITSVNIFPDFASKKTSTLRHFFFKGTFAGVPCRPVLPNPVETCQAVFDYVSSLQGSLTFHLPVKVQFQPVQFDFGPLTESSIPERHQPVLATHRDGPLQT